MKRELFLQDFYLRRGTVKYHQEYDDQLSQDNSHTQDNNSTMFSLELIKNQKIITDIVIIQDA